MRVLKLLNYRTTLFACNWALAHLLQSLFPFLTRQNTQDVSNQAQAANETINHDFIS